jgi:hypothetical protein
VDVTIPDGSLEALASAFTATRLGPQLVTPGAPVNFQVTPSSASDLRVTDLISAPFDLTWITKDVRFNTPNIEAPLDATPFDPSSINGLLAGGMPTIVPQVVSLPGVNTVGTQQLQGVPGTLSQLAGAIPLPIQVPVGMTVSWQILAADDATVLVEGATTFSAPSGTAGPAVSFVFPSQTAEWTNTLPLPLPTARLFVRATVTLTAGGLAASVALPDIPVDIPQIPIPLVAVFFRHSNFAAHDGDDDGFAFILVPNDSPFTSLQQLQPALDTLQSTVSNLAGLAQFAGFLTGLSQLTSALSAQPHIQFRTADASNHFNNLDSVTMIPVSWWFDIDAEDQISSIILVGPEKRSLRCFNDTNRSTSQGDFILMIGGDLFVIVRNLSSKKPVSEPTGSEIDVVHDPTGTRFTPLPHSISTFNDELSSLSFP